MALQLLSLLVLCCCCLFNLSHLQSSVSRFFASVSFLKSYKMGFACFPIPLFTLFKVVQFHGG